MNKLLINITISLIFLFTINCATGLHKASKNGDIETSKRLISDGSNVDEPNGWSYYPLHYAAENGHLEIAKLLIENGAFVNSLDVRQYTPLHLAANEGHLEMVKYLLSRGANKELKASFSASERTPLDLARKGKHKEVAEIINNWVMVEEKTDAPKNSTVAKNFYKDTVTLKSGEILDHVKASVKLDSVVVINAKGQTKEYKKSEVKKISLK